VDFYGKPGLSLDAMAREVDRLTPVVDSFKPDRVHRSSSAIGVQFNEDNQRIMRTDIAQMWVDVTTEVSKSSDPAKIINDVRTALNDYLKAHPESGIESIRAWPIRDGPPVGKPVAIRIEHPDYDYARLIADQVRARLEGMAGVRDVSDNVQLGNRELVLTVDDERASEQGLSFLDVATALRGARDGLLVGVYKDTLHDEDVDVKVRYAEQYVQSPDQLLDTDVLSARTGQVVKLHQVGDLHFDQTYTNRFHYDGRRAIVVTADVDTDLTDAKIVNQALMAEFAPLAAGNDRLNIHSGGQFAETQASFASLIDSGAVALLLMYLILASQFRNYLQPLVVLTTVVFGVIGMVLGLVLNGYPFSVVTGIAMVGLSGVVVNDAIVLLDYINNRRAAGLGVSEAIHVACQRRMRPILLTTITTVAGLAPMAFGVGGYSKIWSPFAMSMCWGLSCATLLTLGVVPALYHIVEDTRLGVGRLISRFRSRSHETQEAPHTT
jgi:HAE1 family hydrophobic/amphiphilic exporter-1